MTALPTHRAEDWRYSDLDALGAALGSTLVPNIFLPGIGTYGFSALVVLLAAWAYPDGCAAVALGRLLGVPVVVKLHGSDINVLGQRRGPRTVMRALLPRAARIVSVSNSLARAVAEPDLGHAAAAGNTAHHLAAVQANPDDLAVAGGAGREHPWWAARAGLFVNPKPAQREPP